MKIKATRVRNGVRVAMIGGGGGSGGIMATLTP
jgi:hypothetical protein